MPYCDVANLMTVTKTNMIFDMPRGYGTVRTTAVRMQHQDSRRAGYRSQLLSKSPSDLRRGLGYSQSLLQTCAEISPSAKFDYSISQIS